MRGKNGVLNRREDKKVRNLTRYAGRKKAKKFATGIIAE
jgi:hypothetical protein